MIKEWLKSTGAIAHAKAIEIGLLLLIAAFSSGGYFAVKGGLLPLLIDITLLPTPLWATIALVILLFAYTYLKIQKSNRSSNVVYDKEYKTLIESRKQRLSQWREELKTLKNPSDFRHSTMSIELSSYLSANEREHLKEIQKHVGVIVSRCGNDNIVITKQSRLYEFYTKIIIRLEGEWGLI